MTERRWIWRMWVPFVLAAGLLLGGCSKSAEGDAVTDSDVQALLAQLDRASERRDAAGVGAHFADDAELTFTLGAGLGGETRHPSKQEHLARLEEGFRRVRDYTYERTETEVEITDDGQGAVVTGVVLESMTQQGKTLRTRTQYSMTLGRRNGGLKIIALEATISKR